MEGERFMGGPRGLQAERQASRAGQAHCGRDAVGRRQAETAGHPASRAYHPGMPVPRHTRELVAATHDSPLGPLLLAASAQGLAGLWFQGQRHWPPGADAWTAEPAHPVLAQARRQLDDYFAGRRASFDLPLDLDGGTDFQGRVWRALRAIPAGLTESYGALAARIGAPRAVRAVGAAVGRNPLSIVVPCHRVVGAAGDLTGYAGGLARKTSLLRLEGALT